MRVSLWIGSENVRSREEMRVIDEKTDWSILEMVPFSSWWKVKGLWNEETILKYIWSQEWRGLEMFWHIYLPFPIHNHLKMLEADAPKLLNFLTFWSLFEEIHSGNRKRFYHRTQGNNLNQLMDSKLKSRKWKRETIGAQTKSNVFNFQLKLCYQSYIWKVIVWKWRVNAPILEEGLHNFLNVAKKRTWWISRQLIWTLEEK